MSICPDPQLCDQFGQHIHGRLYELVTCRCPEDDPCPPPEICRRYRELYEAEAAAIRAGILPTLAMSEGLAGTWTPSLIQQATSFTTAMARWLAAGRPRPTPEQMVERQAACRTCPHRKEEAGVEKCGLCGCPLAGESVLFGLMENPGKLGMSTEQCPDSPPRWLKLV